METAQRTALVLGASSEGGLGEAVARRFAADGFRVIVSGRRLAPLEALASSLGGRAIVCDVTDEAQIEALVEQAGQVDVAVNVAGTTMAKSILKITREQIEAQLSIHVTANILFLKHVVPAIPKGGNVVLFSSITSRLAGAGLVAYGAAKAALDHIVRIAALEFGERGVRVNAVAPGFSLTPMTEGFLDNPEWNELYRSESPIGALVTPEQVAAAVAYLTSPDCFANGEILQLSGGAQLSRLPRKHELKR